MALHDAYARRTPYELALPSLQFGEERFALVAEEAEIQGFPGHLTDIRSFPLLGEVGAILREIRTPDDPPEMIQQYGVLLFHAFHFWRLRFPLVLVSVEAARRAVGLQGPVDVAPAAEGCVYLQLPQHLFWVGAEEGGAPESLDGIFLTWANEVLHGMAVAGVSRQRPGVITMPFPPVALGDLGRISGENMREPGPESGPGSGEEFSTSMPGGEIDGLYGVESAGEALKLAARLLAGVESAQKAEPGPGDGTPPASAFAYRRMG